VYFDAGSDTRLFAQTEVLNGDGGIFDEDDEWTSVTFGVQHTLNESNKVGVKFENVEYDWDSDPTDEIDWVTLWWDQKLGDHADLFFGYTFSDGSLGENVFKGGLLSTQVRIKF
jgi:hypothetical protein